jgi:hypothetical protein
LKMSKQRTDSGGVVLLAVSSTFCFIAAGTVCTSFMPATAESARASLPLDGAKGAGPQAGNQPGTGQFMALSPDKTYLVNTFTNRPVFITGDTAYALDVQLASDSDIEAYLANRQAKGINLIWAALVDYGFHADAKTENDAAGNNPWNGGADFTGMSGANAYWTHVDHVLQRAAAHGITVLAGTGFTASFDKCDERYYATMATSSDDTMKAYGAFLGNRYESYPNIIWLMGGDANLSLCGSDLANKLNDIAIGIMSADSAHLMAIEATGDNWGEASAKNWLPFTRGARNPNGWITLGTIYPKGLPSKTFALEIDDIVSQIAMERGADPFVPFFSMEDPYETEPNEAPYNNQQLRQEGYTEVLGGAYLGRLFGSSAILAFNATCCEPAGYKWQSDLDARPSFDQQRLGQLFRSREHWKMEPDIGHTVVRDGYGSGATLTVTARTRDRQTIIAYIPNGSASTLKVDMTKITSASGSAKCWWFSPSSGAARLIGSYANSGTRNFTPPDASDWVLVVDDAGANLPAPGSRDLQVQ